MNELKHIHTIIFDLGNVLIRFKPEEDLQHHYSPEETAVLMREVFHSREWIELDRGSIDTNSAFSRIIQRNPQHQKLIGNCGRCYIDLLKEIPENTALLSRLNKEGKQLLILSNFHAAAYKRLTERCSFFSNFDGGVISSHVGLLKPDPQIFNLLAQNYSLDPKHCLFIDDTRENIETARDLGYSTLHLQNPRALSSALGY